MGGGYPVCRDIPLFIFGLLLMYSLFPQIYNGVWNGSGYSRSSSVCGSSRGGTSVDECTFTDPATTSTVWIRAYHYSNSYGAVDATGNHVLSLTPE